MSIRNLRVSKTWAGSNNLDVNILIKKYECSDRAEYRLNIIYPLRSSKTVENALKPERKHSVQYSR